MVLSVSLFGITNNMVWRVPNGGAVGSWGPVYLPDTTNAVTGRLPKNNLASPGQQISSSSGAFSTTSASYVQVTNLSVTVTVTGRPVMVAIQPDGSGNGSFIRSDNIAAFNSSSSCGIAFYRDGASIQEINLTNQGFNTVEGGSQTAFFIFDNGATAGSHTYAFYSKSSNASLWNCQIFYVKLVAYEL